MTTTIDDRLATLLVDNGIESPRSPRHTRTLDLSPITLATAHGWTIGESLSVLLVAIDAAVAQNDTETADYWRGYVSGIAGEAQDWIDERDGR